jgi:hypothetical protein
MKDNSAIIPEHLQNAGGSVDKTKGNRIEIRIISLAQFGLSVRRVSKDSLG